MGTPKVAPKQVRGGLVEAIVKLDVYSETVYCVAGPREDLSRYIKWRQGIVRDVPSKHDAAALYYNSTSRVGGVIWLPRVPRSRTKDYEHLVHEASHAILDMMGGRDLSVNSRHQEPFCYAIGYLVGAILASFKERRTSPARRRRPG